VRLLHEMSRAAVRFDKENLVSCVGLVPVMMLAERASMSDLAADKVKITNAQVPSTGGEPARQGCRDCGGMAAAADYIDDLDVIPHGGMKRLFAGVYAPSTLGSFLRAFTNGHVLQLMAVLPTMPVTLAAQTPVLNGARKLTFVDVDSLFRRVYGHQKRGTAVWAGQGRRLPTLAAWPVTAGGHHLDTSGGAGDRGDPAVRRQWRLRPECRLAVGPSPQHREAAGATGMTLVRADSTYYAGAIVTAAPARGHVALDHRGGQHRHPGRTQWSDHRRRDGKPHW